MVGVLPNALAQICKNWKKYRYSSILNNARQFAKQHAGKGAIAALLMAGVGTGAYIASTEE